MKVLALSLLSLGFFTACAQKEEAIIVLHKDPTGKGMPVIGLRAEPVTLKILSPQTDEVIQGSEVPVVFELKNFTIEPKGQHIHVILDNEPYQPNYDISKPYILKDVKPGQHTIRAFPSRAWHESIKDPGAFATVTFFVEKKEKGPQVNFERDLVLTYSRPKGKYEGESAKKILLDFWLKNVNLSQSGYKVKYQIDNGTAQFITKWEPTYIENLLPGKHKIYLQLVDKKGRPVKGMYNSTVREIEVAP